MATSRIRVRPLRRGHVWSNGPEFVVSRVREWWARLPNNAFRIGSKTVCCGALFGFVAVKTFSFTGTAYAGRRLGGASQFIEKRRYCTLPGDGRLDQSIEFGFLSVQRRNDCRRRGQFRARVGHILPDFR